MVSILNSLILHLNSQNPLSMKNQHVYYISPTHALFHTSLPLYFQASQVIMEVFTDELINHKHLLTSYSIWYSEYKLLHNVGTIQSQYAYRSFLVFTRFTLEGNSQLLLTLQGRWSHPTISGYKPFKIIVLSTNSLLIRHYDLITSF